MTIPIMSTIELGLIYSLITLGVYLTFRIINFPDLTVDGTFPLGAAVVAILLTKGYHPMIATLIATFAGMIAGSITAYLYVQLRIMGLLAGILTMTALYSVNIRIMGRPNIALLNVDTLFSSNHSEIGIIIGIVLIIFIGLSYLLMSQYGLALRASGMNPTISRSYGVNIEKMTLLTLAISNGLVALAGALFAQAQGFADISLGTGTIITGIAALMIGEAFITTHKVLFCLLACLVGSILYRIAIALALNSQLLGLQASDLNLITAALVTIALLIPQLRLLTIQKMRKIP